MKAVRTTLRVLALVLALASIALFFFPFAKVFVTGANGSPFSLTGINLAFGTDFDGTNVYVSAYYLVILILSILTAVLTALGLKKTSSGVAALIFGAVDAALFAYVNAQGGQKYIDIRELSYNGAFAGTEKVIFSWLAVIAVIAGVVVTAAALLVNDAIIVAETGKKSIFKKCVGFCKDYKAELRKITWPNWSNVVKNTVVVIVISLIIGAFIWLIDWGLSSLVSWILSL